MERYIVPLHDSDGRKIWFEYTEEIEALTGHIDRVNSDAAFRTANQRRRISLTNKAVLQEAHFSAKLDNTEAGRDKMLALKYRSSLSCINYAVDNCSSNIDAEGLMKLYSRLSGKDICRSITGMHNVDSIIEFVDFYNYYECNPLVKSCIIYYYFEKVHPLRDSSGRIGRLLTQMFLLRNGYDFGKFCSLSQMLCQHREEIAKAFEERGEKHGVTRMVESMLKSYSSGIDALAKMNETMKKTVS
ncbi:MAG TPA: Fic family protein [Clostridiaceae bacterium]|nr:Fic family protein [Clostridiaceae bacterium]